MPSRNGASRSRAPKRAAVAEKQNRVELAEERQLGELAQEFPHLAEVVAGHVAKVGYDFASAFVYGLDLILDSSCAVRRPELAGPNDDELVDA